MFVVYRSTDEALVTTAKREACMLEEWFGEGLGRDLDDYEREEIRDCAVSVISCVSVK